MLKCSQLQNFSTGFQGSDSSSESSHTAPFPRRFRPKYSRTKNGCLTCRRRRKKCDEQRPTCVSCRRNKLECNWHDEKTSDPDKEGAGSRNDSNLQLLNSPLTPKALHPTSSIILSPDVPDICDVMSSTVWSSLLFNHYVGRTSTLISTSTTEKNAFRTHVVELALSDSLLLHTVLAMSGAHLNFNDEAALEIQQAASVHYGTALQSARQEVDIVSSRPQSFCFRLALILLLVCHVEAIAASPNADIFPHLRAVRQLIIIAQQRPVEEQTDRDLTTKGLVLETYAFLSLISNITPYGLIVERTLPLDNFMTNLDHLCQYPTYGTFFGCGHDMFHFIAPIAVLARELISADHLGASITSKSRQIYERLKTELENLDSCSRQPTPQMTKPAKAAREVYRRALLVFLESAINGPTVDLGSRAKIQEHIDAAFVSPEEVHDTAMGTIMLWPLMIFASCCVQSKQRDMIKNYLLDPQKYRMNHLTTAGRLIGLLWVDNDPRAYGPYGLYLTMQQNRIRFSMA